MRAACVVVAMVLAGSGCGGAGGGKPAVTAGAPEAPEGKEAKEAKEAEEDPTGPEAYCKGYEGCAREAIFFELQRALPEGTEPPETEVAEQAKVKVEECRDLVKDLTPEQFAWLQSCTGCGGSCHVYDCMGRVPEDASEPFECDIGLDSEPPAEDE